MRMSDFIVRSAIVPELKATDKEGVIRELLESLCRNGCFKDVDVEDIIKAVLKRELLGSTGIGDGIAIPHTKYSGVDKLVGVLGISPSGVNFGSRDGEPVFVFVLIISPVDQPVVHLRALETVSRVLRDDPLVKALRACTTSDQLFDLMNQYSKM